MIGANITKQIRKAVYRRDGWECALCGRRDGLQIHHVVPRGKGGVDEMWNLITLCPMCHQLIHGDRPCNIEYEAMKRNGWDQESMELAAIEYLSDHYAEMNVGWSPYGLFSLDAMSDRDVLLLFQAQFTNEGWEHFREGGG